MGTHFLYFFSVWFFILVYSESRCFISCNLRGKVTDREYRASNLYADDIKIKTYNFRVTWYNDDSYSIFYTCSLFEKILLGLRHNNNNNNCFLAN